MGRFLLRRLGLLAVTLAVASVLIFVLTQVLPGDVGRRILGPFATQEAVDAFNRQLGFDRPLLPRYAAWIGSVLHGDWGRSLAFETDVLPLVADRFGRSLLLGGFALLLVVPVALACGVLAALREGGWLDRSLTALGLALGALPEFVTGVGLIVLFGVVLRWLPVQALPPEDAGLLGWLRHLLLPALCLFFLLFAYLFRMMRAGMIEALGSDYVRMARLKGLSPGLVVGRHALRNGILPAIGVIGAQVGWLVGGLVVVETLFNYPGLGSLIHAAAKLKDVPLLVGCALAVTVAFAVGNLTADLIHAILDPRVRHGHTAR